MISFLLEWNEMKWKFIFSVFTWSEGTFWAWRLQNSLEWNRWTSTSAGPWFHIESANRKSNVRRYLGTEEGLVTKAFQMNRQNFGQLNYRRKFDSVSQLPALFTTEKSKEITRSSPDAQWETWSMQGRTCTCYLLSTRRHWRKQKDSRTTDHWGPIPSPKLNSTSSRTIPES